MARISALVGAAALVAILGACSTARQAAPVQSGSGVVEQVRALHQPASESVSTYSQSPFLDPWAHRGGGRMPDRSTRVGEEVELVLRMDDGRKQVLAHDNPNFRPGDRVRITDDGKIVRL